MRLIEITECGEPVSALANLSATARDVMNATRRLYSRYGYSPPWVGYLALEQGHCVGTCAFKGPPQNNRVEIAYFTFPGNEGRGVATRMACSLVAIAQQASPEITIAAQTLPEENASTTLLRKNGFQFFAEVEHPRDGKVWEWRLVKPNDR